MSMKFEMTKTIFMFLFVLALIPVLSFSAALKWRSFVLTAPEEVAATPGQEVLINGSVMNTGLWWLRNFSLTIENLPAGFEYKITPNNWDEFRITRDWNTNQGLFVVPEPILISIKVPFAASGLYTVTIRGQEFYSPYKFSNTTTFMLKIAGEPKLTISDISVPVVVYENETFNVSFDVKNEGNVETVANATLNMPSDWKVDFRNKVDVIEPNSTKAFTFEVTPTLTSGAVSTYVEFTYGKMVYNKSKEGPAVYPQSRAVSTGVPAFTWDFSKVFAETLDKYGPVLITIVAVIVIVIAWIAWSMYTMYAKRKSPEGMKKQVETVAQPITDVTQPTA